MAQMTKCIVCEKCEFPKLRCVFYKDGIPFDIVNEIKDCEHFTEKLFENSLSEGLPYAKGR